MPKRPRSAYRVFVSHATVDKWIARMICEKLDSIPGVQTFRDDRDIAGGMDFAEVIVEEMARSDEVLLLLTPTSETRPWVIYEAGMATGFRKRIVPVYYNTTLDKVPNVARLRAFSLNDFDSYLDDLRKRLIPRKP